MRVLHIMASRAQGGAETYACDTILRLHGAGVDQLVIMRKDAPRFAELKEAGVKMAPQALALPFRPLQKLAAHRLVAQFEPDIVHCWMRRAASLAPRGRKNVIGWFGGYYEPRHFAACDQFVGVTRDIAAHQVKRGVAPDRAHYIPTFPVIDPLPPVDRGALETAQGAKVLLTLSRLHQKKGLDTMLHALTSLPDCVLWLAGEGPLRRELEELTRRLGLEARVRFLGWRTDRSALLQSADVCVLPSRYEPFGTVILEAWAARTPLVACASAGPAAHVEDGVNGLLTPIDDVAALAAAIGRTLSDDELRRRMIAEGYAEYEKNYTPEAVTQQWLDFYRKLIASGKDSPSLPQAA